MFQDGRLFYNRKSTDAAKRNLLHMERIDERMMSYTSLEEEKGRAQTTLLQAKLRSPLPRQTDLSRLRLMAQLAPASGGSVTLVSAPPGFGKTTLAATWAARHRDRVAWLSLDEGDNDPVRFWRYVIAALRTVAPEVGETMWEMVERGPPDWEEAVATLLNELGTAVSRPAPITLILDDYHLINASAIHQGLSYLLHYQPSNLSVILLTRADPPLALARLRVAEKLQEVRAADLRFTAAETEAFFAGALDFSLSAAALATLNGHIEGWGAGLQLAALALKGLDRSQAEPFIRSFSGAHRYVLNYLLQEVVGRQPAHVADFLLQTAVLPFLTAPLCAAVTGFADAPQILSRLANNDLFILPLDSAGVWYRYHRLFAEALRGHLAQTQPDLIPELLQRAADWYRAQGMSDDMPAALLAAPLPERHVLNGEPIIALLDPLTERELEVLYLIAEGLSNQQIADQLVIGVGTVKGHINHLLSKLSAQNRTEAVARARRLGLLMR